MEPPPANGSIINGSEPCLSDPCDAAVSAAMGSLPKGSCILCGLASMYLATTATDWTVVTPLGGQKSLPPTPYLRPSINPAQRPCSHICVPRVPLHPGRMEFASF